MDKLFTVSCIGLGHRGVEYLKTMYNDPKHFKVISVCDLNKERVEIAKKEFNLKEEDCFLNEDDFFKIKRSDVIIVSTQDRDHVGHCIKALKLGYDILCEKPISGLEREVRELADAQKKYGHKIFICHVLRYSPAFKKVKEIIDSGDIGQVVMIDDIENVGFFHQAHSFVRGCWRNSNETSPMILAKCCHDMDLLTWYANSKCESISSIGDLRYFKPENQPEGASDRCVNCKYVDTCPYSAVFGYMKLGFTVRLSVCDSLYPTEEELIEALKTGPYGRCVFKCDNNVVDNQICIMKFENGITANLRMTAFTHGKKGGGGRELKVFGTKGTVELDELQDKFTVEIFGKEKKIVNISDLADTDDGHGGGDEGIIRGLYENLISVHDGSTTLEASIESHLMSFAAEESRVNGGKLIKIKHQY